MIIVLRGFLDFFRNPNLSPSRVFSEVIPVQKYLREGWWIISKE